MKAAERGDAEKISSTLSKKGVNPSKLDLEGRSAFHVVASKGHLECLNSILLHGVDLIAPDAAGTLAVFFSFLFLKGYFACLGRVLKSSLRSQCDSVTRQTIMDCQDYLVNTPHMMGHIH
ncbi:hypothetical protein AB205_0171680 [Aquarana catesbeiana]|uniref:Uncharacterized protein n=1 Tax=Aquarana catesbeiana TaxID=8400 RepID=A0A2G9QGG7_AQUCT|nr:hypothetical protein AB205_0171680 [Aquarana catesbeiana]